MGYSSEALPNLVRCPRECHPEMGYTPDGTPTGFDVVVCPNYTL